MHFINTAAIAGYVVREPVIQQSESLLATLELRTGTNSGDVAEVVCLGSKAEFIRDRVKVGSGIHVNGRLRRINGELWLLADQVSVVEQPPTKTDAGSRSRMPQREHAAVVN